MKKKTTGAVVFLRVLLRYSCECFKAITLFSNVCSAYSLRLCRNPLFFLSLPLLIFKHIFVSLNNFIFIEAKKHKNLSTNYLIQ